MAGSAVAMVVFGVLGALTVNPCGAFGDACTDRGSATAFGTAMLLLAAACPIVFVGGLVLLIVGVAEHRHRP